MFTLKITFAGKDVQMCGYPVFFSHSNTTWLHYFSLRLYLRLNKFVCFHHLFTCGYHCCVCERRMGWCLQQKWVLPSAAATPSSHDLLKPYHSSHDALYCVRMRSIIICYPSTQSVHSYLPPWYVSARDHKQPIYFGSASFS